MLSDAGVLAGGCGAAIPEERDRVHGAVVQAQDLLGGIAAQRPANCRAIEAAGKEGGAVARNRQRTHGTIVTTQLRASPPGTEREPNQQGRTNQDDAGETHGGLQGLD